MHSPIKPNTAPFYIPLLALTLASNFVSSALIVYRVWAVSRNASPYKTNSGRRDPLARAIRITIEAGLMYTASTLVVLVTFAIGHNSHIVLTRAVCPFIYLFWFITLTYRTIQLIQIIVRNHFHLCLWIVILLKLFMQGINFNLLINPTRRDQTPRMVPGVVSDIPLQRLVIKTETYVSRDPPENRANMPRPPPMCGGSPSPPSSQPQKAVLSLSDSQISDSSV